MDFKQLSEQFEAIASENEFLKESYSSMAHAMLAFEDKGWNTFGGMELADSFKLEELHRASAIIRENSEANPLLKRGCGLRSSYIFGRGVSFTEQPPRVRKAILEQQNQDVLFSSEAQAVNERSHFTDGQFFVLGDVATKKFQRIPFSEITGVVTDPDDPEQVRYYRRSWTRYEQELNSSAPKPTQMNRWYPADTYEPVSGRFVATIQNQPVDAKFKMFASKVNRRAGQIWGVPDAFPALPWAHAYNEYLKDGSRMLKALSMFAWQLKAKTKAGATAAAATIATPANAGSTAVTGADMELSSMPRSGSVNLNDGRALGSMVASALEVSVVALLSDPGTSGAYGTAQTLDVPTVKAMEARQQVWTLFYRRVMKFLGANMLELEINWPKIETEPSQRMMQALALAHETGALWDDEFRDAVIETLDIAKLHSGPPSDQGMDSSSNDSGSAIPSQGNSGAVGSMQDNANDLRPADNAPIA
jgi:hypothetical protein